ncbi:hypothetical protein JCM6882_006042 [Rhodosporidiobolus microsporus]
MSFFKLPAELKALIVAQVAAQDRQHREKLRRRQQVVPNSGAEADKEPRDALFRGIKALSRTSKEMYELCLPFLFEPLRLELIPAEWYDQLEDLSCFRHCRTARLEWHSEDVYNEHSRIFCQFDLAGKMPKLKALELHVPQNSLSDLVKQVGRVPYSSVPGLPGSFSWGEFKPFEPEDDLTINYGELPYRSLRLDEQVREGVIPGLVAAARRISSWSFGPLRGEYIAFLLSVAPASIRRITLLGASTPRQQDPHDYYNTPSSEPRWETFNRDNQGAYLSSSHAELRSALGACAALELLEIHSAARPYTADDTVHAAWIDQPFPFLSSLPTLSLTLVSLFDTSAVRFLNRFTALKTLALSLRCKPALDASQAETRVLLPSLTSLTVEVDWLAFAGAFLGRLDAPQLETVQVHVARSHRLASDSANFFRDGLESHLSFPPHLLSVAIDGPAPGYALPTSSIENLVTSLSRYGVSLTVDGILVPVGGEQERSEAEKVLEWALWQVRGGSGDATGGGSGLGARESELLSRGVKGLKELKAVMEA